MSADNFFVLRKHPLGGFAWVMGFASDENNHAYADPVSEDAERFETIEAAVKDFNDNEDTWKDGYYPKYYNEYGMNISPECFIDTPQVAVEDEKPLAQTPYRCENPECPDAGLCGGACAREFFECDPFPDQQFIVLIHDLVRNTDTKIVVAGNPNGGYSVRQYDPIDNHLEKTFITLGD